MTEAQGTTILLICDDDSYRQSLSAMLVPTGIHIESISDYPDGLARLRQNQHDFCILALPRNGTAVLEPFLEILDFSLPPLIIIGHETETDLDIPPRANAFLEYLSRDEISEAALRTVLKCARRKHRALNFIDEGTQEETGRQTRSRQDQRMQAMETLAGGLAHDFNNIITAIKGYAELIHDETEPDSKPYRHSSEILNATEKTRKMVQQIMTFSHRIKMRKYPIDIEAAVSETVKLLGLSVPDNIDVKTSIADDCGQILADPANINQILTNLCTNAWQAMPDGGNLEIRVSPEMIDTTTAAMYPGAQSGRNIKISVIDNGQGMAADIEEHIFEPFFSTRKKGQGSGLGLATVHGIVKALNGCISVHSQPGSGSRFDVFIPAADPDKTAVETPEPPSAGQGHGERILLVDDEEAVLKIATQMLSRLGYSVKTSSQPAEALAIFTSDPKAFDLLITDQTMPKMSGVQLANEINKIRPDLPVIMTSGYEGTIDAQEGSATMHFIEKPFRKNIIGQTVSQALSDSKRHNRPG